MIEFVQQKNQMKSDSQSNTEMNIKHIIICIWSKRPIRYRTQVAY